MEPKAYFRIHKRLSCGRSNSSISSSSSRNSSSSSSSSSESTNVKAQDIQQ